jgi:Uri superfamily endonuclease
MAKHGASENLIPAFVPDVDVPEERVSTGSVARHQAQRAGRFLKGPVPLKWIRDHVQCATDRLLLTLRAHADMRHSNEVRVSADVLRDAGISDRKTAYRALERLEASGAITVSRKRGRRPVISFAEPNRGPLSGSDRSQT